MATIPLPPPPADVIRTNLFAPAVAARMAASLLNRHSPLAIAGAVEVLVDVLDLMGGDPDVEDDDPREDHDSAEQDDPPEDNSDTELNGDEGDYSAGDFGLVMHYGIDQSRPVSAANPGDGQ